MPLTILNVAYPLVPVGPDTAGGAEQMVWTLDRELHKAGLNSVVIAAEGSMTSGTRITAPAWRGTIDDSVRRWAAREQSRLISDALRRVPVDVVHLHGLDFFEYLPPESGPCLVTLHLPPDWYPPAIFQTKREGLYFNCVSENQRQRCPPSQTPIRTIPHGIDTGRFVATARRGGYAVVLGRICAEKGFHLAIEAAEKAGFPLVIAGQIHPYAEHQNYFRREIAPRLNSRIRFVGPVGFREKRRLLAGARCLLIPSTAAETSSLVAMEALASGAPVIAFPSGALPEIVDHGRTGFIVRDTHEMAAAIVGADRIPSKQCSEAARSRFSLDRMMREYLAAYSEISQSVTIGRC